MPVVLGGAAAVLVAVIALVAHNLASDNGFGSAEDRGRGQAGGSGGTAADARPCSDAPQLNVQSVDVTPAGLAVSTEVSAACTSGDVVSSSAFQVTVTDGGRDVASGVFDLAVDPVVVPPGETVRHEFVFPAGMYWRPPEVMSGSLTISATSSGRSSSTPLAAAGSASSTAVAAGAPKFGTADAAALSGLRDLVASDLTVVRSNLENWWVPQISSKRPGLAAEGIVWDNTEILREHLSLRQRYPDVRLVWSGDWRTFNGPDWWVTIVGIPSADAESALDWCDAQGLDADHCYAKIISSTRGVDGTTVLRR